MWDMSHWISYSFVFQGINVLFNDKKGKCGTNYPCFDSGGRWESDNKSSKFRNDKNKIVQSQSQRLNIKTSGGIREIKIYNIGKWNWKKGYTGFNLEIK